MLNRLVVTPLLIIAVIVCPMWCSAVTCFSCHCLGDECHAESELDSQAASLGCTKVGCCAEDACGDDLPRPPEPQGGEHPIPHHSAPEHPVPESNCRGLCIGAVFEKAWEIDDPPISFLRLAIQQDEPSIVGASHGLRETCYRSTANAKFSGKFVRTLLMSYLC